MSREPYLEGIPKTNKYFNQEEGSKIMNNQECCKAMPAQEEVKIKEKLECITAVMNESSEIIQKIGDKLAGSYYYPQEKACSDVVAQEPKNINEAIDVVNSIAEKIRCAAHKIDELI